MRGICQRRYHSKCKIGNSQIKDLVGDRKGRPGGMYHDERSYNMKKTQFFPYLLKRVVFWLITLALIVGFAVGLRVYKDNNTCYTRYCYGECGYRWCWGREHGWIHGCD